MAIVWGAWSNGQSGSKSRLGVERKDTQGTSSTTVKLSFWVEFSGYYANSNTTLVVTGAHSGNRNVTLTFSGSGTRHLGDYSASFTRPYGTGAKYTTNATLTGFAGGSPSRSTSFTIQPRSYSAPGTPTRMTNSRVNDSSSTIAWTVPSSTSAPVSSVEIQRETNNSGWVALTTSTKASGSMTVTGQNPGNRYRYRVRGRNSGGNGAWATSPWVYQTPVPVGNPQATRSGNNIVVSWTDRNAYPYGGFRIYDNGAEVGAVNGLTTSWTHANPSTAVTHRYQIEAYYGNLKAARVSTNTVQLLAAPLAPTNLTPSGVFLIPGTHSFSWVPRPTDGTDQTAYEFRLRRVGLTDWTTYTGTTATSRSVSTSTFASSGQAIEWQVRTKGAHADFGPWSAVATVEVLSRPTVAFTSPASGAAISSASVPVSFTISRVPASWSLEVWNTTDNVAHKNYAGYATESPVTQTITGLRDGKSYQLRLTATDRTESTQTTRTITASFPQPAPPTLTGEWEEQRAIAQLYPERALDSTVQPSQLRVERLLEDGETWVEIATTSALTPDIVADPAAPLDGTAVYRAIAIAVVGADTVESAPSDELALGRPGTAADYLTFGDQVVRIRYNTSLSRQVGSPDLTLVQLDDGTADPVALFGPAEAHTVTLAGLLVDDQGLSALEQARAWRDLGAWKDLVLLRPWDGSPVWGVVGQVSQPRLSWGGYEVSLTHTKAR